MNSPDNIEYRIARLHERLATGELGELGVRIEAHGTTVTVTGTVPSADCRDRLTRRVREELADHTVHFDLVVAQAAVPDDQEELS